VNAKRKIVMLQAMTGTAFDVKRGDVVDWNAAEAQRLIEKGYAAPYVDEADARAPSAAPDRAGS
jgi:hypothetical protein